MNLEQQFNTVFDQFPTTDVLVHNRHWYSMHYRYHKQKQNTIKNLILLKHVKV